MSADQHRDLRSAARDLLAANDAGTHTTPSGFQYPHQWNWDSALIAIGLSYVNVERALSEISSLLSAQWDDGMVPHIVFHRPDLPYFPDASFWQTEGRHTSGLQSSGITQPPVVASALRRIAERHDITDFLRDAVPRLVKWHRWFHTTRAVDATALTATLHPWESGTDDSPRWLDVLARFTPTDVPPYRRVDTAHVDGAQRPTDKDYERFVHLVELQRKAKWDPATALATSPFLVQDVMMNAILLRADDDLIWLGERVGVDTSEIAALRQTALAAFNDRFWNERRGLFLDYDVRNGTSIPVNTAMTFMPMWARIASPEQAARLVEHLRDPAEYWTEPGEGFMVTTAARNEPTWSPVRYWRGPVWVLMNWFLHDGLSHYGESGLAERVKADTVELLQRHGFVEYHDANTGDPCGARAFSWSAALALDLLGG
jgi:glycogen debranching enzyme